MYLINYCEVGDADKDGFPEFYLDLFWRIRRIRCKPLKVIVYTKRGQKHFQIKITGWIYIRKRIRYHEERDVKFPNLLLQSNKTGKLKKY